VYTTAALSTNLEICGPLAARIFAASSAKDTDWTAKLLDVHPNGYAQRLTDGIVRARFRNGFEAECCSVKGGGAAPKTIDLNSPS
jgi:predicted acyl esterase